jgi:hypothetical protein
MSTDPGAPPPGDTDPRSEEDLELGDLSEDELRAAYEAELQRIRVEDVIVQTVISLLNLGARKAGLAGAEEEPDFDQVRQAIDATRALLPLVEPLLGAEAKQVRDALSQLQIAYARSGATPPAPAPPAAKAPPVKPGETGPAQQSGRLWVPGQ